MSNRAVLREIDPGYRKIVYEVILPVSKVTSCIFGGDNFNDLYITTVSHGLCSAA
ncbi:MAG: SMP-30/gluconolactonase/LRE family protein [Bacteroidetes bacterium]|nr:SMP-30/gluconolactonase/LRE family protein [Bacteroidota bacterium]MCH8234296.1 SMP-30/gluconolactonase/LRE family protein [Bacteroidota bacterium]